MIILNILLLILIIDITFFISVCDTGILVWIPFIPFYCINTLARNFSRVRIRGVIIKPYPVCDLKENAFSVSPLSTMFEVR